VGCVRLLLVGAFAIAITAGDCLADFLYTSQTRYVTAFTHGPSGNLSQTFTASNYNQFDQTAFVQDSTGFSKQHQNSLLGANSISAIGDYADQRPTFAGTGAASGRTVTDVTFDVPTTTDVDLSAAISISDTAPPGGSRIVSLTGPSASISWAISASNPTPWTGSRSAQLTLTPGSYRLLVDLNSSDTASGDTFTRTIVPSFNVQLSAVPEPALAGMLLGLVPLLSAAHRPR